MDDDARTVASRIEHLAALSEEPGLLVRRSFTPAMRQANDSVVGWMRAAGLAVREDALGNLIGRYEGLRAEAGTFILGSHLDSVRDAGKYDGPLGVLVALTCIERLQREGKRLPFAVEIIAFTDEEGLRFHTSYLGSSAVAGVFEPEWLELADADGITVAEALRAFGGDPTAVASCAKDPREVRGYCEVHIEQGPVLETLGLPVGVVGAIIGQDRVTVTFNGSAGHAGTVPMAQRHDALCAAAEWLLAVERLARESDGMVATVGQVAVQPGASNVIPGRVTLSLDLRHRDDSLRMQTRDVLHVEARAIGARRGVGLDWQPVQSSASLPCSPVLMEGLARAIVDLGYAVHHLVSGAGHDAVSISALTGIAMLFVRCAGGISHHPAESVAAEDMAVAIEVLYRFLISWRAEG